MLCPSCGHGNRDDAQFCDRCTAELGPVCPSCQMQNDVGAHFCRRCRQDLGSVQSATRTTRTPTPQPSPALPTSLANGRYQVQRFLGEGGRKRVYLDHDERLDRDVAIGRRPA